MDPNSWLRFETEDGDEEEATGLMIVCRVPATAAERKESRRCSDPVEQGNANRKDGERRGSSTSETSGNWSSSLNIYTKGGRDRVRMAALFVNFGADVNMRDAKGRTALIHASMNGLREIVYYLLVMAGADYRIQESNGMNSLMYSLPFPSIVRTYLEVMDEVIGRPDSSFWRQRTRLGKSIFDLAKESVSNAVIVSNNGNIGGPHKSLQLLTTFITNDNYFQSFKPPAPLPEQLVQMQQKHHRPHHHHNRHEDHETQQSVNRSSRETRRKSHQTSGTGSSSASSSIDGQSAADTSLTGANASSFRDVQSFETRSRTSPAGGSNSGIRESAEDQQLVQMEQSMKRSRSLKEFWEKETIDWFSGSDTHNESPIDFPGLQSMSSTSASCSSYRNIPPVVIPTLHTKSTRSCETTGSGNSMFLPMNQVNHDDRKQCSSGDDSQESVIKLPPIHSPLIRHEEWRQRGHSLNRRTSVTLLRTVNPIH